MLFHLRVVSAHGTHGGLEEMTRVDQQLMPALNSDQTWKVSWFGKSMNVGILLLPLLGDMRRISQSEFAFLDNSQAEPHSCLGWKQVWTCQHWFEGNIQRNTPLYYLNDSWFPLVGSLEPTNVLREEIISRWWSVPSAVASILKPSRKAVKVNG